MENEYRTSENLYQRIEIGLYGCKEHDYIHVTNGITEGFVNKLKVVKRIMYGKASIGLLKNKLTMEHVLFN